MAEKPDKLPAYYHRTGTLFAELARAERASQIFCREQLAPVGAARYNSPQSVVLGRQPCDEGTHTEVLDRIMRWGKAYDSSLQIYWMDGTAKIGKTTIAYHICSNFQLQERLAASFFCSRLLAECRDIRRVIPTIAYQLAQFSRPFQRHLHQALKIIPSMATQELAIQFRKLIKEPIMAIKHTLADNLIVIIDALDELEDAFGAQTILKLIFESATEMPVKFLITSRPDHGLLTDVMLRDNRILKVQHLHVHEAKIQVDQSLQNLHQQHVDVLYISTLKEIFEDSNQNTEELNAIKLSLLWSAACIQKPPIVNSLAQLVELDERQAVSPWGPLRFVLGTPIGTRLITAPPTSFLDFIFSDRERSGEYICSGLARHGILAQRCFELMQNQLRFNISSFNSSLTRDYDIRDPDAKVNPVVSDELFYSCLNVGAHLELSAPNPPRALAAHLHGFIVYQLLAWLEVLNLKHTVNLGVRVLSTIETWLHENNILSDLIPLVHDARKFVASFAAIPASCSTPHIYVSLLSSWPPDSPMSRVYGNLIRDIVAVDGFAVSYPSLYPYYSLDFLSAHVHNTDSSRRLTIAPPITNSSTGQLVKPITEIPSQARVISVRLVTVSADNKSIISASGRLAVSVWNREAGKGLSGPFYIRPACFGVVAFSHDARRIATASSHCEVFVWDASTEKLIAGPFKGHQNWVTAIAFSPDGNRIVSGARDQAILMWDICTPDTPVSLEGHHGYAMSLVFSPKGSHVVSASTDHIVRVWDLRNESPTLQLLTGHNACVRSVDVSPDGTLVVSGADDHTIIVWDMTTGQSIYGPFNDHSHYVLSVKFSPDGQQVVSGSQDCSVRVWDINTGQVVAAFTGHTSRVNSVTFSTDGTQVISGSDDGTIRIWNVQPQTDVDAHSKTASTDSHSSDDFNAPGTWKLSIDGWVVNKDERILMWIPPLSHYAIRPPPPDQMTPMFDLPSFSSMLNNDSYKSTAIPSSGITQLVAKSSTGQPVKPITEIPPQVKSVRSVTISADNRSIISASGHLAVSVWDRETGKGLSGPFDIRPACFGVVAFSFARRQVATASSHCEVFVWDASTEKLIAGPFKGHQNWVTAIAFSPDGARIVSGARDQAILMWDICTPDTPVSLEGHHGYAMSLVFSPTGSHVVSASTDHMVRVWDLGTESPTVRLLMGHNACVRSVDVSPDGTLVVSGADDHTIIVWDMSTGETVYGPFGGHVDYVLCVKFSPDGQQIVSGSQDCSVRVWDINTGQVVAAFTGHTSRVNTVTFSTDGTQAISGSDDGTIRIWNVQPQTDVNAHSKTAPADSHPTDDSVAPRTWKLNPDGWVVDRDERLLMWLPPLSHSAIRPPPPDHILMPRFDLPISSLLEGKAWRELCRRQEGKSIRYEIDTPVEE